MQPIFAGMCWVLWQRIYTNRLVAGHGQQWLRRWLSGCCILVAIETLFCPWCETWWVPRPRAEGGEAPLRAAGHYKKNRLYLATGSQNCLVTVSWLCANCGVGKPNPLPRGQGGKKDLPPTWDRVPVQGTVASRHTPPQSPRTTSVGGRWGAKRTRSDLLTSPWASLSWGKECYFCPTGSIAVMAISALALVVLSFETESSLIMPMAHRGLCILSPFISPGKRDCNHQITADSHVWFNLPITNWRRLQEHSAPHGSPLTASRTDNNNHNQDTMALTTSLSYLEVSFIKTAGG